MEELMKETKAGSDCAHIRNGAEEEIRLAQEQESEEMDEDRRSCGRDRRTGGGVHGQSIQKGKRLSWRQLSGGSGHPAGSDAVCHRHGDPETCGFL